VTNYIGVPSRHPLEEQGLRNLGQIFWNLPAPALVEQIVARKEGSLSTQGAVVVTTGKFTGRSPDDKLIVQNFLEKEDLIWWGPVNHPIQPEKFERLDQRLAAYLQGRDVFVQDLYAGAHSDYQVPIRVITELAWHSLFAQDLFIRPTPGQLETHVPECTVIHAPGFMADPELDGTRSETFIILDLLARTVIIGGTSYAGEVKKSVFSLLNYLLPQSGILPMHCSANQGTKGDVALFFGLSGTGKTTLSSDPDRALIGDDEHGWGEDGVFNFEGGCYAKTIHLRKDLEPIIFHASGQFGTVLENVVMDPQTREVDFDDGSLTENTRAAYPMDFVPNHVPDGCGSHPGNIFFLTADAFGVLPPLARLSRDQALYYFLSGYTSKLAGTEKDLGTDPQATFSACFGSPFLPLHPQMYARILGEKIDRWGSKVWLINTGWTGGPYGIGQRIRLSYTRAMIRAVLNRQLDEIPTLIDPFFGLTIPSSCPEVPQEILFPQNTWPDPHAYVEQAGKLIERFENNIKQYAGFMSPQILAVGPGKF
jgi:phosphoenolpyruvate carboxykinase (ATP)